MKSNITFSIDKDIKELITARYKGKLSNMVEEYFKYVLQIREPQNINKEEDSQIKKIKKQKYEELEKLRNKIKEYEEKLKSRYKEIENEQSTKPAKQIIDPKNFDFTGLS